MENLEPGLSLRQAVDRYGPLPEPSLRRLAEGIAQALTTIHAAGSVHGAAGPDSVLLAADGPYLVPSETSVAAQGAGSPPDDMFGLGATLLYAASGTEPTWEGAAEDLSTRIRELEATTSVLPESLREVIGGCLYPDPSTRPTAGQLVYYLNRQDLLAPVGSWLPAALAADLAIRAASTPSTTLSPSGGLTRRNLLLGLAGGAVVVSGVTAAVLSSSSKPSPPNPLDLTGGPTSPSSSTPNLLTTTPTTSPSSSDGPAKIPLEAPDATKAWTVTGQTAPTFIKASDKAILVITSQGTTLVDAATGKRMFPSLNTTNEFDDMDRCSAAYADGIFYYLCFTQDSSNTLAAVDSATNAVKWATTMADVEPGAGSDGQAWSPICVAVSGNTVYVCGGIDTGSDPESTTGYIRAFDRATGKGTWHISGTDIDNVLVPSSGPYLLATSGAPGKPGQVEMIDAGKQGARGWKKPIAGSNFYFSQGWPLTCYAAGSFVFYDGDTVFVVDAATGTEKWHYKFESENGDQVELGSFFASPDGATIYAPVGSDLAALATVDGTVKWVAELTGTGEGGMADLFNAGLQLVGHHAECCTDTVFVTDSAKTLWAIDAATGKARWKYNDPGQPDVGFKWTVGGDRVFVASNLTLTAISIH